MDFLIFIKIFRELFIFRTDFETINATRDNKEDYKLLRRRTQGVYDILANLSIFTIKIQRSEYLEEYFIDFPSPNIFLRIGEVPKYLHPKNFKKRILIKKLSLFDTNKCTEIFSCQDVYLGIYNDFIGFQVHQQLKHNIETIINTHVSFDLQLRIIVNETIGEFSVFHIYKSETMMITISSNTTTFNGGIYLETFPYYSMCKNPKYFLALFSYVRSILRLTSFITKVYTDHTQQIISTKVSPPMFMLTKKFQNEKVFEFSTSKGVFSEFLNIQDCIHNDPSCVIEYIIQKPLDTTILEAKSIEEYANILPKPQIYAMDPKDLKNILSLKYNENWDITFTTKKSWKVNSSLITDLKLKFEFDTKISDFKHIIVPFVGYTIIDDQWVMRTIKVKNTHGLISSGLQKMREVIQQGGTIICRIISGNNIGETYILNFDHDNTHLLIMEEVKMIPKILYPYISCVKEKNMELCWGQKSPLLDTIPEDNLPTRTQFNYITRRPFGRKMVLPESFISDFDKEDEIFLTNQGNTESDKQPAHIYIKTISENTSKERRTRQISSTENGSISRSDNNEPKLETSYFIERPEYRSFYESEENLDIYTRGSIDNCNRIEKQLRRTYNKSDKYLVCFVCLASIIIIIIGMYFMIFQ